MALKRYVLYSSAVDFHSVGCFCTPGVDAYHWCQPRCAVTCTALEVAWLLGRLAAESAVHSTRHQVRTCVINSGYSMDTCYGVQMLAIAAVLGLGRPQPLGLRSAEVVSHCFTSV